MDPRAAVMRCSSPILVNEYVTKDGVIMAPARRPCGRCLYCCWRDAREAWGRSDREFEANANAGKYCVMGSLTSDELHLPALLPDWGHAAFRAFTMRVSARVPGLKWFGVPEFGELRGRLHGHFMVYGVPPELCEVRYVRENGRMVGMFRFREIVRECWHEGFERCDVAAGIGAGRYVMKYLGKGRKADAERRQAWREAVLWPAMLEQARQERERVRAWGLAPRSKAELQAELPKYSGLFWTAWPQGRQGGLGRGFAEALARSARAHPLVRAGVDLPAYLEGAKRRKVRITRYERRVGRRLLGLDSEASKALRAARDPERVEIAWRIERAGGVRELRKARGHVDKDVAAVFEAKARMAKSLGRW